MRCACSVGDLGARIRLMNTLEYYLTAHAVTSPRCLSVTVISVVFYEIPSIRCWRLRSIVIHDLCPETSRLCSSCNICESLSSWRTKGSHWFPSKVDSIAISWRISPCSCGCESKWVSDHSSFHTSFVRVPLTLSDCGAWSSYYSVTHHGMGRAYVRYASVGDVCCSSLVLSFRAMTTELAFCWLCLLFQS